VVWSGFIFVLVFLGINFQVEDLGVDVGLILIGSDRFGFLVSFETAAERCFGTVVGENFEPNGEASVCGNFFVKDGFSWSGAFVVLEGSFLAVVVVVVLGFLLCGVREPFLAAGDDLETDLEDFAAPLPLAFLAKRPFASRGLGVVLARGLAARWLEARGLCAGFLTDVARDGFVVAGLELVFGLVVFDRGVVCFVVCLTALRSRPLRTYS